jgi:hypothetical protein
MTADAGYLRLVSEMTAEIAHAKAKHPREGRLPLSDEPKLLAERALRYRRDDLREAVSAGAVTHRLLIECEFAEALAESDPVKRREELIQVMCCCARAIEDLDAEIAEAGK